MTQFCECGRCDNCQSLVSHDAPESVEGLACDECAEYLCVEGRGFRVGDRVFWNDPGEGVSSGEYRVSAIFQDAGPLTADTVILINSDAGSEAEVVAAELRFLNQRKAA
jgi:hypothetical protein